jgi:tRNA nucleotidyltransferase (CCA-adding enzyme)
LEISKALHGEVKQRGDCVSLKELAISGKDLILLGMEPGKEIGEKLTELLERVLEQPELNKREILLGLIRE